MTAEPFDPRVEHFFVVGCVKDDDGNHHFFIDDETCEVRFPGGSIWNNKFGEWRTPDYSDSLRATDRAMFADLDSRLHAK